jgi:U32 family peptidase
MPELLAPAGGWDCAKAAVANGADAIYFGLQSHNARLRADNFTDADLPELMRFLHRHGVRGFVAMNTLVFAAELPAAAAQLALLDECGVDAVIIQDLGLASLARAVATRVELHASTQMTISSPEGLAFVHRLVGLDLAVLARELSLDGIGRFQSQAMQGRAPQVPLEVFVHGALCVAYSGQCLTSEALGQRSANRGECAQACRMPYEMIVDGVKHDLGDRRHLLSPQDLATHDQLGELLARGVTSFKIEGRLKSPDYVAAVTRAYRKALDAALAGREAAAAVTAADRYALEMTFSRGLGPGWLLGTNHPALVHGRFGKKRGQLLGRVVGVAGTRVELDRTVDAVPGDGIVFDTGGDTNAETGGRLTEVAGTSLVMPAGRVPPDLRPGHLVWKTSDPRLEEELRATWKGRLEPRRLVPIEVAASGRAGEPLRLRETSRGIEVASDQVLEPARQHPLDRDRLAAQLGRLGDTRYRLESLEIALEGELMLPLSALNRLRRSLVAALDHALCPPRGGRLAPAAALASLAPPLPATPAPAGPPELAVLVRTPGQLAAAVAACATRVIVDFEDIRRCGDALAAARDQAAALGRPPPLLLAATPRIHKAGETGHFRVLERARPDGLLLRNLGALEFFRDHQHLQRTADFTLNVANPISARLLIDSGAVDRLTVSYDLNIRQVLDLLASAPPEWFELTIHQHMPMFHMEHCVFCTFLSSGTDYTNCGRPCESHRVELRDRVGVRHVLQADVGCRNTLFRGQAQTGASFLPALRQAGLARFRIELLREDESAAARLIAIYQDLLAGRRDPAATRRRLNADTRLGVTEGTLLELSPP